MSDRLCVYKTPLHRISETAIVVLAALGLAALWQAAVPDISSSYVVFAALLVGFVIVPRCGSVVAERLGGPMMTPEARTRRYLSEVGPIGLQVRGGFGQGAAQRRGGGRNLRRG